jgi:hypothetical protein
LRELRRLREENGKLKRLATDLSLDRHTLQEIVQSRWSLDRLRSFLILGFACLPAGADWI